MHTNSTYRNAQHATPNMEHRFQYDLALLAGGSATVSVQQLVGCSYQNLPSTQTQSTSGTYTLAFEPTEETIRIVVASTNRFALTKLTLDRDHVDTLVESYALYAGGYRYGFNGMERDDQVSGAGNSYTAEFWQYDSRLGRRWNIDPMTGIYPWQSPYSTFNNNPIFYVDPLGLEGEEPTEADREKGTWQGPSGKTYNYDKDADMWYKPEDVVTITAEKKSMISQLFTDIGRAIGIGYTTAGQPKTGGKGSEWLGNMTLGNHFGNGPSIGREGKGRFYTDKNSPHYDSWMRGRANHAALENFMGGYMGGSLAAPFVIAGAITTAPVWTPYLAMGANYTTQVARAYHTTFGMKGGYASIAQNILNQSITQYVGNGNISLGNYDLLSIGTSGFLKRDAGMLLQMAQGSSGVFVQLSFNDGWGGAIFKPTSSGHILSSTLMSTLTPLLNKTPIFPSLNNEAVPAFGQGAIDRAEKEVNGLK